ncbi:MAG: 50S ribosomal protein L29 [Candidatus Aminicenantaceae bacterium]|jgi:large subunit ribosomal protein L29
MKPTEMRELSPDELADKEAELKDQLFKLRFQHALGQLENTMKLKTIKKDLARIKTIQNESGSGDTKERNKDK